MNETDNIYDKFDYSAETPTKEFVNLYVGCVEAAEKAKIAIIKRNSALVIAAMMDVWFRANTYVKSVEVLYDVDEPDCFSYSTFIPGSHKDSPHVWMELQINLRKYFEPVSACFHYIDADTWNNPHYIEHGQEVKGNL